MDHWKFLIELWLGKILPIELKYLFVILSDTLMEKDQARITVNKRSLIGPIVTADNNAVRIDNDAFRVAFFLSPNLAHVEAKLLDLFQNWSGIEIPTNNDPHIV